MMLLTGQPLLQNGVPQSMQRALWTLASSSFSVSTNSWKFLTRFFTGSWPSSTRSKFMKPVTLPIAALLAFFFFARRSLGRPHLDRLRRGAAALGLGDRVVGRRAGADLAQRGHRLQADLRKRPLVLVREHLDELAARLAPVIEDLAGAKAPGPLVVIGDERLQLRLVGLLAMPDGPLDRLFLLAAGRHRRERDHRCVAARCELAILVVDVGDATA